MKKNAKKIFVVLLLAVIACGSYFISSTYAKYSRELAGSDTATVAKFSVSAGELNKEKTADINLFGTVNEADTTTTEEHVSNGKIAPGTGGQFTVELKNNSEVDVQAKVSLVETNSNPAVPIEYSFDNGSTWTKASDTTKTVDFDRINSGKASPKLTDTLKVMWRWTYAGNDVTKDTELGEKTEDVNVITKVSVVFTQVD